jgi:uncharacterized protein (TIGR00661 family)
LKSQIFNTVKFFKQNTLRKLRVLVAPLDWGLGHATRCVPIINELLRQDCDVWIASDGAQASLLRQEFPELSFLPLPGYSVKYGRSATGLIWKMFTQSRKILKSIKAEHRWLSDVVDKYGFDAVISDNRYGLYHTGIPSVFITHQLAIKSPLGAWSEKWLQLKNYRYIDHFSVCWVPDAEAGSGLAGELSHPAKKPRVPLQYIGSLSRFEKKDGPEINRHLVVILSGPEPQRSLLENIIIRDIAHYNGTATVVRGLPTSQNIIPSTNSIRFYNHLPGTDLNKEMNQAEYVISRSGYSTVMDLTTLGKKSILIPTPGQTEQEYLGRYLHEKKIALCISQKKFSLDAAIESAKQFSYTVPVTIPGHLEIAVSQLISSLKKH